MRSQLGTLLWGSAYVVASTLEVATIKALNYEAHVYLATYSALILNQLWLLLLPGYLRDVWNRRRARRSAEKGVSPTDRTHSDDAHPQPPHKPAPSTKQVAVGYLLFSFVTYGITLLRNVSANNIPGGTFSLLISTSIVFNIALSRIVLKRQMNRWHMTAAALCLGSAVTLGYFGTEEDTAGGIAGHRYAVGIPAALGAAFCIASSSIISDKVTRDWPDKDFRIIEMTIVASIGASILLVPTLFALGEHTEWPQQLTPAWDDGRARAFLISMSVAMPFVKAGSRVSKYETISHSSSFAFEFVQASAALISAVANVLIFGEHWSYGFIGAAVLMLGSFGAYMRARSLLKAQHREQHLHGQHHHDHQHDHPATGPTAAAEYHPLPTTTSRGGAAGYMRFESAEPAAIGEERALHIPVSYDKTEALDEARRLGWLDAVSPTSFVSDYRGRAASLEQQRVQAPL